MKKNKDLVSQKVQQLAPSGIRAFFDLVLEMKEVISLGVGEPDFITPWNIRETGIFSLEQGFTSYTSNKGMAKLRRYIQRYLKQKFALKYDSDDEILITVGVSEAVDLAIRAVLNPGEEVIIPQPCYVSYGPVVELAGGKPVYISSTEKNGFKITPRELELVCNSKTKAIILNYPANPTGVSYSKKELLAINKVCKKYDLVVITDEVYAELVYESDHIAYPTLPGAMPRTIYLNGFSKAFAMTGWRLGFACGPKSLIAAMTKIHQYTMLCAPIMSQIAACEALQTGRQSVEQMRKEYHRRRDFMYNSLNEIGLTCLKPEGAFYIFPNIKKSGLNSFDFANQLLKQHQVALVPGVAFGDRYTDNVRISYATDLLKLKEAIRRMKLFLDKKIVKRVLT